MSDFSFRHDYRNIDWGRTLMLNLLRATFAGVVLFTFITINQPPAMRWSAYPILIVMPIGYLLFYLPLGLIASGLSKVGVPYVGLLTIVISLMVAIGDPFVFILHKLYPPAVPVERFWPFNFSMIIFVLKPAVREI